MVNTISITKEMLIKTATQIICEKGDIVYVSIREIAKRLNVSTKLIFDLYDSVEDIIINAKRKILNELIEDIMKPSDKYTGMKRVGMTIVLFAKEKPNLFNFLFMSKDSLIDRNGNPNKDFMEISILIDYCTNELINKFSFSEEIAHKVFNRIWYHTIILCNMCVMRIKNPTEEQCSILLSKAYVGSLIMLKQELQESIIAKKNL